MLKAYGRFVTLFCACKFCGKLFRPVGNATYRYYLIAHKTDDDQKFIT